VIQGKKKLEAKPEESKDEPSNIDEPNEQAPLKDSILI
jgi:hypothetical protein